MHTRSLTFDDKALRKAAIDDFCARNGVERIPAVPVVLDINAMVELSLQRGTWMGRSKLKTEMRAFRG